MRDLRDFIDNGNSIRVIDPIVKFDSLVFRIPMKIYGDNSMWDAINGYLPEFDSVIWHNYPKTDYCRYTIPFKFTDRKLYDGIGFITPESDVVSGADGKGFDYAIIYLQLALFKGGRRVRIHGGGEG